MGIEPVFNLQQILAEQLTLNEVIVDGPGGLKALAGGADFTSLMAAWPNSLGCFLSQIAGSDIQTDYLISVIGAGLGHRVMTFCKLADEILLVTTPDPTSVTDAYATAKVVFKRAPESAVKIIVKMASDQAEAQSVYRTLSSIASRFLSKSLDDLEFVPTDSKVSQATRQRVPYLLSAPNCYASKAVREVAKTLRQNRPALKLLATYVDSQKVTSPELFGRVAKLVYALDLGSSGEIREGSSPSLPTNSVAQAGHAMGP